MKKRFIADEHLFMTVIHLIVIRKSEQLGLLSKDAVQRTLKPMYSYLEYVCKGKEDPKSLYETCLSISIEAYEKLDSTEVRDELILSLDKKALEYLYEYNLDGSKKKYIQRILKGEMWFWNTKPEEFQQDIEFRKERISNYVDRYIAEYLFESIVQIENTY